MLLECLRKPWVGTTASNKTWSLIACCSQGRRRAGLGSLLIKKKDLVNCFLPDVTASCYLSGKRQAGFGLVLRDIFLGKNLSCVGEYSIPGVFSGVLLGSTDWAAQGDPVYLGNRSAAANGACFDRCAFSYRPGGGSAVIFDSCRRGRGWMT